MKVKHFHIRLNKENLHQDEEAINSFMQTVIVKKTETQHILSAQANYWSILVFYVDIPVVDEHQEKASEKPTTFDLSTLNTEEKSRYEVLKIWRADTAIKENFPHYIIAHNSQLGAIAKLNPSTTDELLKVKGFSERKITKYGDDIIAVLNSI